MALSPENNSGLSGTATLTDLGNGQTRVQVRISPGTGDRPAHIHDGQCGASLGAVVYPLTNVQNGTSQTDVAVSVADLQAGTFAINLHESPQNIPTYVACGNILAAAQAGGGAAQVPRALPRTGDVGSMAPLATAAGAGLLGLGLALRRRIHR